jgi:flotillin
LSEADLKIIANAGNVENGMKSLMDIFSSNGGTHMGAMLEGFAQSEKGAEVLNKFGLKKPDVEK